MQSEIGNPKTKEVHIGDLSVTYRKNFDMISALKTNKGQFVLEIMSITGRVHEVTVYATYGELHEELTKYIDGKYIINLEYQKDGAYIVNVPDDNDIERVSDGKTSFINLNEIKDLTKSISSLLEELSNESGMDGDVDATVYYDDNRDIIRRILDTMNEYQMQDVPRWKLSSHLKEMIGVSDYDFLLEQIDFYYTIQISRIKEAQAKADRVDTLRGLLG